MSNPVWCLRVTISGVVYNFATEPVEITSAIEGVLNFDAGLVVNDVALGTSATVAVVSAVDWKLLAQQVGGLTGAKADLRRWVSGVWERTISIVSNGEVKAANYTNNLRLSLTVSQVKRSAPLIDTRAVVDFVTFPTVSDAKIVGQVYPRVYGYPGHKPTGTARPVVPLLFVVPGIAAVQQALFAGHHTDVERKGGNIKAWRTDVLGVWNGAAKTTIDALGQRYSYIDGTGSLFVSGREYHAGFELSEGGGIINETGTGPIRGAGEVLLDLLRLTGDRVDESSMRAQFPFLNAYKLDFYINESSAGAREAIQQLIGVLPVTEENTPDGVYYQAWNWRATRTDAVALVDVQRDAWSLLDHSEPEFTPYNRFTVEFGYGRISEGPWFRIIMAAELDAADSRVGADRKSVV